MKINRNILVCAFYGVIVLILLLAGGCSSTMTSGQSQTPRLTFDDIQPLPVNAAAIDIVNQYDPATDPHDVSSLYPVQPDIVLRRFAEKRLKAAGSAGTFRFIIENATVYYKQEAPETEIGEWLGTGGYDRYEVMMRLRLALIPDGGAIDTNSSVLTLRRAASIPASHSIAAREEAQINLIDTIIRDLDREMTNVINVKMGLLARDGAFVPDMSAPSAGSGGESSSFVHKILAAPEMR